MNKLTGKVAVVTGASKGIGAGIAKALAAEGAAVAVNYASSREGADRVVTEITANGGKAVAIQGDMSKAADVKRLFAETKTALGTPNILVNNAGIFEFGPFEEVSEEQFHQHYNINVLGPILTTQEAVKYFPAEGGSVINISTIASINPVPYSMLYASSKAAVDTMSMALAKELGPRNIRVNMVAPGFTDTEGNKAFVGSEIGQNLAATTPLGGRFGKPEDIAPVVVFLASDDAAWLTGERISASGGVH
ncbi:3-oxoacyl-[acyl-carrier protein] reductase [Paenibacillus sp. yr247]|uniref:SDR family NAD(P)-dependent oxidoreductase n=1 Tax=Paenibacillus sp. yr247 TaxID=1761880 RepID=UPI00087F401E|nr:glucose 1-dehydrogenase [Paenibacillus sp. yr247]SDN50628.1 3-oxoacyl-[acyl-carrier protein] reductase [Paenibacillus sp. yr247]